MKPARIREALVREAATARRNRALFELQTDLPLPPGWSPFRRRPMDRAALTALFEQLEFRSLLKRLGLRSRATPERGQLSFDFS